MSASKQDTVRITVTLPRRMRDRMLIALEGDPTMDYLSDYARHSIMKSLGTDKTLDRERPLIYRRKSVSAKEIVEFMRNHRDKTNGGAVCANDIADHYDVSQPQVHTSMWQLTKTGRLFKAGYEWQLREGKSRRGNQYKRRVKVALYKINYYYKSKK